MVFIAYNLFKRESRPNPFKIYAHLIKGTYRIGFTNLNKETHIDELKVTGKVPTWLSGTLIRNGPAKFTQGDSWVADWFDGLAMLHAFSFNNGKVSYTNKFLRTDDYATVLKTGKMSYAGFAQDPCRSIFRYFFSYFMPSEDKKIHNANVNVAKFADHFVALTETPLPVEFDPHTLDTLGVMHYKDGLPERNIHDTAHPHYDPKRKEHLGYFTKFGRISSHNLFRISDGTTQRKIIASVDVQEPSYMHSFAITEHYAILTGLPLVVNPLDLLLKKKAFIKNFKWKPELGTQLIIFDRINDKVIGSYKTEPFFAFHTVNAFEEGDSIVLDIVTYSDGSQIGKSTFNTILGPGAKKEQLLIGETSDAEPTEAGILKRYIISLIDRKVTGKTIFNKFIELPRINYEKVNGKDYTYIYAFAEDKDTAAYVADMLVKINVKTGKALEWKQEKCYPGEPVFIPSPNAQAEDDGVVLSVILDAQRGISFLLVLDAQKFIEIGRAEVPHHIPFGIHGAYFNR